MYENMPVFLEMKQSYNASCLLSSSCSSLYWYLLLITISSWFAR